MGLGMDLSWNPSGGPTPRPAAPTRRIDLGGDTHGMDPQAPCRSLGLGDLECLTVWLDRRLGMGGPHGSHGTMGPTYVFYGTVPD